MLPSHAITPSRLTQDGRGLLAAHCGQRQVLGEGAPWRHVSDDPVLTRHFNFRVSSVFERGIGYYLGEDTVLCWGRPVRQAARHNHLPLQLLALYDWSVLMVFTLETHRRMPSSSRAPWRRGCPSKPLPKRATLWQRPSVSSCFASASCLLVSVDVLGSHPERESPHVTNWEVLGEAGIGPARPLLQQTTAE